MRASYSHIESLVEAAANVPGDFAEAGVWRGDTCEPLCQRAHELGKRCFAIDSFVGLGQPTERDYEPDGVCRYRAGGLNAGGDEGVGRLRARCAGAIDSLVVVRGWIPEVLAELPDDIVFAFVHVDLDHYAPTLAALRWFWPRLAPGGVLCCHDWFPGRGILASAAFDEFTQDVIGRCPFGPTQSNHGWVIKP